LPGALAFVGMGMTIAGCVAVGVVLGLLADAALHTSPAFLVVGLVLGVASAAGAVTAQVRRYL
jgi:F0F1-type ATP synthase assembly protein I